MCIEETEAMRVTLTIADDVLQAARALAKARGVTIGEVISDLARRGLLPEPPAFRTRNGIPLLPVRAGARTVTPEHVRRLLEADDR
jgi:hypothetical protein